MGLSARHGDGRSVTRPSDTIDRAVLSADRPARFERAGAPYCPCRRRRRAARRPTAPKRRPRPRALSFDVEPTMQPQPAESGADAPGGVVLEPATPLPPVAGAPARAVM